MAEQNVIKILGVVDPPYVTSCFKNFPKNCPNPGVDIMLLYYQIVAFGFRVEFVEAADIASGFKLVLEGLADITGFSEGILTDNPPIKRNLSTTMPLYQDRVVIYHREIKEFDPPNLLFDSCSYSVWLFVLATLLLVLSYKAGYKIFLTKYCPLIPRGSKFSSEFPLIAWSLAFATFSSIYSQYLGITLSRQLPHDIFKGKTSFRSSLQSGECSLSLNKRNVEDLPQYFPEIQNAFNEVKFLNVFDNDEDLIKKIKEPGCNLGVTLKTYFIQLNALFGGLKSVHQRTMPQIMYYYFYRKDHPLKKQLSILNSGSAHSKYSKYLTIATNEMYFSHKRNHPEITVTDKPLSLKQLESGFWLLGGGLSVSLLICVVSKVCDKIRHANQKEQMTRRW